MKSSVTLTSTLSELKELETHIRKLQDKWSISKKDAIEINLVLDELVTNIIEHGERATEGTIEILFSLNKRHLTIEVIDGGSPFDPTSCKKPDTSLPLDKRKCGGLGVLLVHKFSDCCNYTRLKDKNIFSLTKKLTEERR